MRPPSPLLILLYITLSKSQRVVSKRGSGIYPSPSESLMCAYYMKQGVYVILCSTKVTTNNEKRMSCRFRLIACVSHSRLLFCKICFPTTKLRVQLVSESL